MTWRYAYRQNFNIRAIWQIWPWRLFLAHLAVSRMSFCHHFASGVRPSVRPSSVRRIYILICKIHNLICKSWIGSGPAEHPRTIVTKFGFNWSSSSRGEDLWMKSLRRTDAKWWQNLTLATARWAKKSRLRQICSFYLIIFSSFFIKLLLSLPNKVWETYCFCSVSYYYYPSSPPLSSPFFPRTMNLSTMSWKRRIAPLMVTYHYVKSYVSIIIHLEVININVQNFNFPIGFYSNPTPHII
jgi:hypothetical protein